MSRLTLEPIYGSLLFAVIASFAIVAVITLFTPESPDTGKRRVLIALRSLAAFILLLAAFGPSYVRTDNRPAEATLVVAVDTSRSMTLPDGDGGDRWTSQRVAWRSLSEGLRDLDESLVVKLVTYDEQARTLEVPSVDALDDSVPDGDLTDLSAAAAAAINVVGGQPMAGVVLMGDGTQTARLADDGARRIAETLNALGVPLWCVPIGPAGGRSASRDAAIDSLPQTLSLFAGNEFDVSFQVVLRGLAGVSVPVRLAWIDTEGKKLPAASRNVVASQATESVSLTLTLTAPPPGTYRLSVEADEQKGEWVTQNNRQVAFVDVREGGGRILYVEGMPRIEQTFLRLSLKRFPDLDLSYRWVPARISQSRSNASAAQWPIDFGDRFRPGKFDLYILGDIHADAIGDDQLAELAEAVAQGAGLITLGGFNAYGDGGYSESALSDVLPIRMSESGQIDGPLDLKLRAPHPIIHLGAGSSESTWKALPPLTGANRWADAKSVPGVEVVMESSAGDPLMVTGEFGRGRVAAIAFDSTWRWWRAGKSEIHRRFWRQTMLWALAREESSRDQIRIEMDARRFSTSDQPEYRARLDSLAAEPSSTGLVAELVDRTGQVRPLSFTESVSTTADGAIAAINGSISDLEPGFHTLRVRPTKESPSIEQAEMTFQVVEESRELDRPMADPVYLRQLADLTADHGGASYDADEMSELLKVIAQRRTDAEIPVVEKNRLGDGPLSGWILFTIFAAALGTEWLLRRKWSMA